jgi:hypothetical protein
LVMADTVKGLVLQRLAALPLHQRSLHADRDRSVREGGHPPAAANAARRL